MNACGSRLITAWHCVSRLRLLSRPAARAAGPDAKRLRTSASIAACRGRPSVRETQRERHSGRDTAGETQRERHSGRDTVGETQWETQ
jgi:hypothetical protein